MQIRQGVASWRIDQRRRSGRGEKRPQLGQQLCRRFLGDEMAAGQWAATNVGGLFAPRRELYAKYFELLFHTAPYRAIYAGSSNGMTVGLQNLSNQNFYNVRCIVPPIDEQAAIIAHTDRETLTLNTTITRLEREIELLREYRTRLVSDVVTGKLDVREAAALLPDEPMREPAQCEVEMDDATLPEDDEVLA